jgi:hypothetical protein
MSVESVQTKWGPLDRHSLKALKDGYAAARRDSLRVFKIGDQEIVTQFAKYLIEYAEGEGLTPCSCH